MASDFNPYHKWLGIPPGDQPPHHYRLLGIDPFESDLQVIESAADRQMTFVRTFQGGPHSSLSQRILNELAAAKIVLLRPEKKTAYDQALRAKLAAGQVPASAPRDAEPATTRKPLSAQPVARTVPLEESASAWSVAEPMARKKPARPMKKSSPSPLVFAGGGAVLIAAVVGVVLMQRSSSTHDVAAAKPAQQATDNGTAGINTPPTRSSKSKNQKKSHHADRGSAGSATLADATAAATPKNSLTDEPSRPAPATQAATPAAPFTLEPKVAKSNVPATVAPGQAAAREPIDLLKLVDLQRDAVGSPWSREGQNLISPSVGIGRWNPAGDGGPRLRISPAPQSSTFRLNLDVQRLDAAGSLVIGLPVGAETRIAIIDGKHPASSEVDHRFVFPGRGPNELILSNAIYPFPPDRPVRVSVIVAPGIWRFEIDGRSYFQFDSQRGNSWASWAVHDQPALFVGGYGGSFRFSKLELVNLDALPPPAPQANNLAASSPAPRPAGQPLGNIVPSAPIPVVRAEPPSAESQAEALARIKEIYRDDYKDVGTAGRTALAAKMARQSEVIANTPVERYVLLNEAATLAAGGNDMLSAAAMLTTLGKRFVVDEQTMKLELAQRALKHAVTNQQRSTLLTQLQVLAESAVRDQHYAAADDWFELALNLAKTTKNLKLAKQLKQSSADLKEITKRSAEADAAKKQLAAQADSPDAHLVLGKFLCFLRDDWREGLSHLAQGGDKPLSDAANRDLQTSTDVADQVAVGDAWFSLGEKSAYGQSDRAAMHQRASSWYTKAVSQLTGKDKIRVQTRLTRHPRVAKPSSATATPSETPRVATNGFPAAPTTPPQLTAPQMAPGISAPPQVVAPSDPDLERQVAMWAIQAGSGCSVSAVSPTGRRSCRKLEDLPAGPFYIDRVSLLNIRQELGQEIKLLPRVANLRSLTILSSRFPHSDDLARVIGQLRNLTTLHLNGNFASPELACSEIGQLTQLDSLSLSNSNVSNAYANAVQHLSRLQTLSIHSCGLSDAALPAIGKLTNLRQLTLGANSITDAGLAHLQGLVGLEYLNMDQMQVTDAGLAQLSRLTALNFLTLNDTKVTGAGMKHLAQLTNLNSLFLNGTGISDQDVGSLTLFPRLFSLSLSKTNISDAGLQQLNGLTQLKNLIVSGTRVTPAGIQAFTNLRPNCKVTMQ